VCLMVACGGSVEPSEPPEDGGTDAVACTPELESVCLAGSHPHYRELGAACHACGWE
jgi:hypothetical protein